MRRAPPGATIAVLPFPRLLRWSPADDSDVHMTCPLPCLENNIYIYIYIDIYIYICIHIHRYSLYSSLVPSVISMVRHLVFNTFQQVSTRISVVLVIDDGNGQRHLILTPLEGHLRCHYATGTRTSTSLRALGPLGPLGPWEKWTMGTAPFRQWWTVM